MWQLEIQHSGPGHLIKHFYSVIEAMVYAREYVIDHIENDSFDIYLDWKERR